MIHAEGWHYIQIGRSIERAAATATMLEMHFDESETPEKDGTSAPICRGRRCCGRARRSKRIASAIPPTCGPSGWPSSSC